GIEPCAVNPFVTASSHSAPLWPTRGRLPVGSATTNAPTFGRPLTSRASAAAPVQPVSSPAVITRTTPGVFASLADNCRQATTKAATPLFMSDEPRPQSFPSAIPPP